MKKVISLGKTDEELNRQNRDFERLKFISTIVQVTIRYQRGENDKNDVGRM